MSKKLGIKGHSTRGNEIIELLEMMGGINKNMLSAHIGDVLNPHVYFLEPDFSDNRIVWYYLLGLEWDGRASDMMIFTLEEFLDKYPYKLNDLALCDDGLLGIITKMEWDCEKSDMKYYISFKISDYNKWYSSKNIKCTFMEIKGKKLAIKGHSTRGKEVIELLEMIGGKNTYGYTGDMESLYFSIYNDTIIYGSDRSFLNDNYVFFTLEEFLEKYPFKVGDKVYIKVDPNENCLGYDKIYGEIESAMWVEKFGYVVYKLKDYSGIFYREDLHPYKEEVSMEDNKLSGTVDNPAETKSCTVSLKAIEDSIDSVQFIQSGKIVAVRFNTQNYENEVELQLDDYEIEVRDGKTYAVKKKPKYPTTYAECCEVLVGRKPKPNEISFDKMELCLVDLDNTQSIDFRAPHLFQLNRLFSLLMCLDAYWKIAGEEMGLDKPWEPDWKDTKSVKYAITLYDNVITKMYLRNENAILVFPTEEMRDVFYKNFKHLIEQCKELL